MKSRNRAVLWVVLIFLAGALFGGALSYLLVQPTVLGTDSRAPEHRRDKRPSAEQVVKDFSEKLNLDADQQVKLREILERGRQQYRDADKERWDRFRSIRQSTRQEIRAILRLDQLEKFEEFLRREDERHQKRRKPAPQ